VTHSVAQLRNRRLCRRCTGRLLCVLKVDPAVEPAPLVRLSRGQCLKLVTCQGQRGQQRLEDLPHVRELAGKLVIRRVLGFPGLLDQLGKQRGPSGQMTCTGMPRSRAYATTSPVPP
jgi:hypothetical protein